METLSFLVGAESILLFLIACAASWYVIHQQNRSISELKNFDFRSFRIFNSSGAIIGDFTVRIPNAQKDSLNNVHNWINWINTIAVQMALDQARAAAIKANNEDPNNNGGLPPGVH